MKIAVVGTGYVGLVSGACFAEMGIHVVCIDIDTDKINQLKKGIMPIYEPGLETLVQRNVDAKRLHFSTNLKEHINKVDIIFSAVGTPSDKNGSADLQYVLSVAKTIGENLNKYNLIVTKSTVPVGTSEKVRQVIKEELTNRNVQVEFDVASNPEFLKEGAAIKDFMSPDRVVVGVDSTKAEKLMTKLYKPFMLNKFRIILTDIISAEMIKYAANAMLATRISFMNDIANLCDLVGADVNMVRKGIGSDSRIGSKFLYPGCGYGGSCFPKDVKALINTAEEHQYEMLVLKAVEEVNEKQKNILFEKLHQHFEGDLYQKNIAVWGLSFKPETDDIREAPSLNLIKDLLKHECNIKVYDPVAMDEFKKKGLSKFVHFSKDIYEASIQADAIILVTEWKEFRIPNWEKIKKIIRHQVVIDGRNIYDKKELKNLGFDYLSIGK